MRRRLQRAAETLDEDAHRRLRGLLAAGDPHGEVTVVWHAKEAVREFYSFRDPTLAATWVDELVADCTAVDVLPPEVRKLGRTLARWKDQLVAWHVAGVSNGPTEAMIIWSPVSGVVDVADGAVLLRGGRVIWRVCLTSPTSHHGVLTTWPRRCRDLTRPSSNAQARDAIRELDQDSAAVTFAAGAGLEACPGRCSTATRSHRCATRGRQAPGVRRRTRDRQLAAPTSGRALDGNRNPSAMTSVRSSPSPST